MKKFLALLFFLAFIAPTSASSSGAHAEAAYEGLARPWQLNFQIPATPVMESLDSMHHMLLWLISIICLFVLVVLLYICVRFRRKANPVPSRTTHHTLLEIIWTAVPILILIAIAIPSLRLHYYMQRAVDAEMTLKVVGYQWYWHYDYPDHGGFGFDSYIKKAEDLQPGDHRLLAVDNRVVVPVDTTIRVLTTGADVIHAWAVPAFGVKRDAVPGRLNETWFKATRTGTFFGQCSELCGINHAFMPIVVDVVSKEDFATWVAAKKQEAGITDAPKAANGKELPAGGKDVPAGVKTSPEKDMPKNPAQVKAEPAKKASQNKTKEKVSEEVMDEESE
jgi:cytochrome c oxidase subunit II